MEFKGTKGKWFFQKDRFSSHVLTTEENAMGKESICFLNSMSDHNDKANGKLISKAPEMLEMLKTYLLDLQNVIQSDARDNRILQVEKLIKQATEI